MANIPGNKGSAATSLTGMFAVILSAFIIAVLYFGRDLLVPLALAILLAFLLNPLVTRLQRWIGRVGSVISVVAVIVAATIAAGWMLTLQVVELVEKLPDYKDNIRAKLEVVQQSGEAVAAKFNRTVDELKKQKIALPATGDKPSSEETAANKALPVEVVSSGDESKLKLAQVVAGSVFNVIGTAAIVFLLLIFMLLQREDMRNRMIRLIGQGHLTETTQALDDAGSRVSRYLLMQLVVNVTYGIPAAIGLYFIGVPNAMLWGVMATVLRFVPYLGPWIAASFPIVVSLAASPGWTAPLLTIGLYVALELLSNNLMEPWLYGSSTGVTPIAVVVAALVWTSLWGPVGLVLSTPLTVCLVVMGRRIPKLAFLNILLSDQEALTPAQDCYQRILSLGDHDEMELVNSFLKSNPPSALIDSVLIPVMISAGRDQRANLLDNEQLEAIEQRLAEIVADVDERLQAAAPERSTAAAETGNPCLVACVGAKAHRDEVAGKMLAMLLRQQGYGVCEPPSNMPAAELADWLKDTAPEVVFISAVPPTSAHFARSLCSRLRINLPQVAEVVGLWGRDDLSNDSETAAMLHDAGADEIVVTMADGVERLARLKPNAGRLAVAGEDEPAGRGGD